MQNWSSTCFRGGRLPCSCRSTSTKIVPPDGQGSAAVTALVAPAKERSAPRDYSPHLAVQGDEVI